MRSLTWNRLPTKFVDRFLAYPPLRRALTWIQIRSSLNHRKKGESRAKSADSSKVYRQPRAFYCSFCNSDTLLEQRSFTLQIFKQMQIHADAAFSSNSKHVRLKTEVTWTAHLPLHKIWLPLCWALAFETDSRIVSPTFEQSLSAHLTSCLRPFRLSSSTVQVSLIKSSGIFSLGTTDGVPGTEFDSFSCVSLFSSEPLSITMDQVGPGVPDEELVEVSISSPSLVAPSISIGDEVFSLLISLLFALEEDTAKVSMVESILSSWSLYASIELRACVRFTTIESPGCAARKKKCIEVTTLFASISVEKCLHDLCTQSNQSQMRNRPTTLQLQPSRSADGEKEQERLSRTSVPRACTINQSFATTFYVPFRLLQATAQSVSLIPWTTTAPLSHRTD